MGEAKVYSTNISQVKGTVKESVNGILVTKNGIKNDGHAGHWHRQVSLLAKEKIDHFSSTMQCAIKYGEFAENITTVGIDLATLKLFDQIKIGKVELQVTQIGKECHGSNCAIFRELGKCVMPKEGIFCRVIKPGFIKPGDYIKHQPKVFRINVITLSDRAFRGEYVDKSGPVIEETISSFFKRLGWQSQVAKMVIADDKKTLNHLLLYTKRKKGDLLFTSGGTGIGPRDITIETVRPLLDKEIPGVMDAIRIKYGTQFPSALLSSSVAGVMGKTLIFTLPGSPKAVKEYMTEILLNLEHMIYMLYQIDHQS